MATTARAASAPADATTGARSSVRASTDRVAELIGTLDQMPDQGAASIARELLQIVLDLHGAALAALLDAVGQRGGEDRQRDALLRDEAVEGVLLLHGLHPAGIEDRARAALDRLQAELAAHGVDVDGLECRDGRLNLRLAVVTPTRFGDGSAAAVRQTVDAALQAAAPDAAGVEIHGLPARVVVVPLSSITVRPSPARVPVA